MSGDRTNGDARRALRARRAARSRRHGRGAQGARTCGSAARWRSRCCAPTWPATPPFQARFRREAQSAASLNAPSVVAVYDTGEDELDGVRVPYIVMEYVEGQTLRDLLREGQRLMPNRALEITAGVLGALDYSHRHGIVHRDIKPANVMLDHATATSR